MYYGSLISRERQMFYGDVGLPMDPVLDPYLGSRQAEISNRGDRNVVTRSSL